MLFLGLFSLLIKRQELEKVELCVCACVCVLNWPIKKLNSILIESISRLIQYPPHAL